MAYSGINVDQDDNAELVSGGAIMDAIEHKDPSKSIPKKKAKKKAPPKKKKEEDEDAEESSPKEEVEKPKPKTKSKNEFLDSVLESTISNKKTSSESSKLNSFEKQQQDENDVWASIAKDGPDAITGDDDEPKKKTKKAHKVSSSESSEMSDEAVAVEASTLDPLK